MKKTIILIAGIIFVIAVHYGAITGLPYLVYHPWFQNEAYWNFVTTQPHINYILWCPLAVLVFALFLHLTKKQGLIKYCKYRIVGLKASLLITMAGIGAGLFMIFFERLSFVVHGAPDFRTQLNIYFNSSGLFFNFLGIIIVLPLYEETLYRGIIFNLLRERIPVVWALILQSAIYSGLFFFINLPMALFALLPGILFGLFYYIYDSVIASFLVQAVTNVVVFIFVRTGADMAVGTIGDPLLWLFVGVSSVIVVFPLVILFRESFPFKKAEA